MKILAVVVVLIVVFVFWRWTSVDRGGRERDEKLLERLDPIGKKLEAGEPVSREEIEALAIRPEMRFPLFRTLRILQRTDLLPTNYSSLAAQGESALAYWMMHPNEEGAVAEKIELVEAVKRPVEDREATFFVYRYKMPAGHWAAKDGWQLGVVGPMTPESEPYAEMPNAFSRGDIEGQVKPAELVDWWVDMLRQKGAIK